MIMEIGHCDTCDYILKCTRSGLAKKIFGGCPKGIVEEYESVIHAKTEHSRKMAKSGKTLEPTATKPNKPSF